jgi:hypothetical protein
MALSTANAAASGSPKIQAKYHIATSFQRFIVQKTERVALAHAAFQDETFEIV